MVLKRQRSAPVSASSATMKLPPSARPVVPTITVPRATSVPPVIRMFAPVSPTFWSHTTVPVLTSSATTCRSDVGTYSRSP